jgi:hypothetical protein
MCLVRVLALVNFFGHESHSKVTFLTGRAFCSGFSLSLALGFGLANLSIENLELM